MKRRTKSLAGGGVGLAFAFLALAGVAQDETPPAEESPPSPAAPESAAERPRPPPPPSERRPAPSGDEFVPSEELQADERVTFPVDI